MDNLDEAARSFEQNGFLVVERLLPEYEISPVSAEIDRVAIGDSFLWLYEDTLDWNTVAAHIKLRPHFVGHESLRALKLAATRLKLSDSQIEDILYNNARRMLGL